MAREGYSRDELQLYSVFKGVTVLFGNEVSPSFSLGLLMNRIDVERKMFSDLPFRIVLRIVKLISSSLHFSALEVLISTFTKRMNQTSCQFTI